MLRDDPEGVHQMRVGLRRLRAGMSLFSDLLCDPQTAAIKSELKWLAAELGPARELEVLVNRVVAPIKKQRVPWEGVPSLGRQITKKRKAAVTRAKNAVKSARFRALTLELAAWLPAQMAWFPWLGAASALMLPWSVATAPPKLSLGNTDSGLQERSHA